MNVTIRNANTADLQIVGQLAMKLVRQHQSYNPLRFVNFDNHEKQLVELLSREVKNAEAVVVVAEFDGRIVGYIYVSTAEASLVEMSGRSAWLDDIYVAEAARGLDVGKQLLQAAVTAARDKLGSRVLMLHVAQQNERARTIFENYGFQPTIVEMMLDLSSNSGN